MRRALLATLSTLIVAALGLSGAARADTPYKPSGKQVRGARLLQYRAFGERINLSGGAPARTDPTFQNRTYDAGLGIYDYRNRSFDPATGRFLQRDPVLGGDPLYNPYCFPGNNPVTNADPMGNTLYASDATTAAALREIFESVGLKPEVLSRTKGEQKGQFQILLRGIPELTMSIVRATAPVRSPLGEPSPYGLLNPIEYTHEELVNMRIHALVEKVLDDENRWTLDSKGNTTREEYGLVPLTCHEAWTLAKEGGIGLGQGGLNVVEGTTNSVTGLGNTCVRGLTLGAVWEPIPKINLNVTDEPEDVHRASTFFGGEIGGSTLLGLGVAKYLQAGAMASGTRASEEAVTVAEGLSSPTYRAIPVAAETLPEGVTGATNLRTGAVRIAEGLSKGAEIGTKRHEAIHRIVTLATPKAMRGGRIALYKRSSIYMAAEEFAAETYATGGRVGLAGRLVFSQGYTMAGGQSLTVTGVTAEALAVRTAAKAPEVKEAVKAILGTSGE